MRVVHEHVAGIDVHKDMIKVAIRSPGERRWTRTTEILEFRTFYGVLQEMARLLRRRGVTHVVTEASGVYTEPVYYALAGQDFNEVAVVNPAHVKALKGHKTGAADCRRLAELSGCGLLRGSYIPPAELKEVRDLTRYRMKTVQARTSEIQRLGKALESAGIKLGSVASEITGKSATGDDRCADRRGAPRRGAGGPGQRPDADRRQAGGPVDGAGRPVHRASRADVPAAPGPDHAVRHRRRRPGRPDRGAGPGAGSRSWTCSGPSRGSAT